MQQYLIIVWVVNSSSQIPRREHFPFPDWCSVFNMLPLSWSINYVWETSVVLPLGERRIPFHDNGWDQRTFEEWTFIEKKEFVGSWDIFESENISSPRAKDAHRGRDLIASGHTRQLVTRPDAEYRSNSEVGVDDARTIEGIKCHTKPTCASKFGEKLPFFTSHGFE